MYYIGYPRANSPKNIKKIKLVESFQRKYRQNLINGKIDQECLLISKNLRKKR